MGTIYIIAGIIYLIVTIVVVVKICQTANNTAEIRDLLAQSKNAEQQKSMPNVSATDENGNEKTIMQMRQEQEAEQHREKTLYEQQQEYWQ